MFNDFSNQDDKSSFFQDGEAEKMLDSGPQKAAKKGFKFNSNKFLGMNAQQRFILAALLLVMVCTLGTMLLMVTGSIMP